MNFYDLPPEIEGIMPIVSKKIGMCNAAPKFTYVIKDCKKRPKYTYLIFNLHDKEYKNKVEVVVADKLTHTTISSSY